jgi:Zn-dependent peptidase ImmA (M78 family)
MTVLTLDPVELADVGGRPDKLAAEILRQMRSRFGDLPLPIPTAEVAKALGIIEIQERETESFDGALVVVPDRSRGFIVLRKGLTRGRRNFTLGHEVGHLVNPYHKPPPEGLYCGAKDLAQRRQNGRSWRERPPHERMEVEANEFSSHLLVPRLEFAELIKARSDCDIGHVVELAKKFDVSKEMMAQLYVAASPEKVGVVTSKAGRVMRCILPDGQAFPYLGLSKGQLLPSRSRTAEFLRSGKPGSASSLAEIAPDVWLDRSSHAVTVYEQVLIQEAGWAMTLLVVEDANEDGGAEAIEANWYEPRFTYGR